jgi:mannosyltransferase OCH1-like enzyme
MAIPQIIHQTWKTSVIPSRFSDFTHAWKRCHPSWRYQLWDDGANRRLIQEHYPWFLRSFDNFPLDIQRADAVRYFILHRFGGIYVDLDMDCFKSVKPLLKNADCVFSTEPEMHARLHNTDTIISNAFMGSVPGHPFLFAVIKEMLTHVSSQTDKNRFVLETTGPLMIVRVYQHYQHPEEILLLPPELLNPLSYLESERYLKGKKTRIIKKKIEHAYGLHFHTGTWWKTDQKK